MTPEARRLLSRLAARPGAVATPGERRALAWLESEKLVERCGVGVWKATDAGKAKLEEKVK